jgi:hypothetical protein
MDLGLGRKFKLGRNNLSDSILSRACPRWTKTAQFRAFRAESQILGWLCVMARNVEKPAIYSVLRRLSSRRFRAGRSSASMWLFNFSSLAILS